jgi:hypothetical protein
MNTAEAATSAREATGFSLVCSLAATCPRTTRDAIRNRVRSVENTARSLRGTTSSKGAKMRMDIAPEMGKSRDADALEASLNLSDSADEWKIAGNGNWKK